MKRFLCLLALLGACDGGAPDEFDITRTASAQVQGNPLGSLLGVLGFGGFADMRLSNAQEFANQGVKANQVDSIKLSLLRLKVKSPAGQDLTFLSKLEFFAKADGLDKVRVASGEAFAKGATSVDLKLDGVELKPYVVAASMSLTTEAKGQAPKEDTTIEATVVMHVDVDVTGVVTGN